MIVKFVSWGKLGNFLVWIAAADGELPKQLTV